MYREMQIQEQILVDRQKEITRLHENGYIVILCGGMNKNIQNSNTVK